MLRDRDNGQEAQDRNKAALRVQPAVAGPVAAVDQVALADREEALEVLVAGQEHSRVGQAQAAVAAVAQARQELLVRAAQRASRESQSGQSAKSLSRERLRA